ncbi:MAG: hypothetical protein U1C70_13905 [Sediminibacterium sp.]|jgi:hypothetical protein|uniref:hypothetical protein n=1 Tax=Sediminibacterium sp. TaxID=1917865 RepID=UPI002ABA9D2D|nr:hypothetical protein [Sediminibacterium sp.]MDZ4072916.1 hypothetical protein [Sediminibacterium sp.]
MEKQLLHFKAMGVMLIFLMMIPASTPPRKYTKPVTYPCVQYPPLTYSPILLKINVDANYTPKDLAGMRESAPTLVMEELKRVNYNFKLADGVRPNLVLFITFTNDGYNHYGVILNVDWQGQGNFTISLPNNYITVKQLFADMANEFNRWVINGWHSGNCK